MRKYTIVIDEDQRRAIIRWAKEANVTNFGDDDEVIFLGGLANMVELDVDVKGGAIHDFTL
jgi:hypothetical protein